MDDLSAFLAFSEEQISKFSRCRVPSAIFAMQNIMVFFHFGTGIIMVYHGIFFWNLLRTMLYTLYLICGLAIARFSSIPRKNPPENPLILRENPPEIP